MPHWHPTGRRRPSDTDLFTDSHCHLTFPELASEMPAIREAMRAAQVTRALCICTTIEEFPAVHALANSYDNFWCSVGVHPDNEGVTEPTLQGLVDASALPRVVAIGETGLDYYQMDERKGGRKVADLDWQRERFRVHIRAARACGKPLIIHTRSAARDTIDIMREEGADRAGGVMHCFTETLDVAREALDLDFHISFSGIVTFKNARELKEVARAVPLERMLIETDAPYLAPVPHRGKVNEPGFVSHVAEEIARLRGIDVAEVEAATTRNFFRLFGRADALAAREAA